MDSSCISVDAIRAFVFDQYSKKFSILQFKRKCNKELNAIIYTDEKVIQSEVEKMVKLIKSKL